MSDQSIKHDMDNASITLKRFTKAISPVLQDIVDYVRERQAYHIASERQLEILERSMGSIEYEAEQLVSLAKQLINNYNEDHYDQQSND